MIQLIEHGLEGGLEIREIHDPAHARVDFAAYVQFDAERMTMEPRALVPRRRVGQAMRGFDRECTEDVQSRSGQRLIATGLRVCASRRLVFFS
jgi:hypothetical protein